MTIEVVSLLTLAICFVALLYSSVGHAGASGYITVMTLFNIAPTDIRPTSLALNILVACIATRQFWRAGHFSWQLFWPFALLSVPMAFVGGYFNLPTHTFKLLVGVILLLSAAQLIGESRDKLGRGIRRSCLQSPASGGCSRRLS